MANPLHFFIIIFFVNFNFSLSCNIPAKGITVLYRAPMINGALPF